MKNSEALKFFHHMATAKECNPQSVKLAHNTDYTSIDATFILQYADKNSSVLDIGSGTGLTINKIYDKVQTIECVEPFKRFTDFITNSDNVIIHNCNVYDYETTKVFDVVTLFGVMHYFSEDEVIKVYKKCYGLLKKGGIIIVKNQFGIHETVEVSGYSEENKTNYYSSYRKLDEEMDILKNIGFENIEVHDIYPPEANRWDNTHFYAIVGRKPLDEEQK